MEILLEQFKILFDRPEKVKRLRELILQLAVRGKLVPQDESDEPAAVLLERIKADKDRLVKEGKTKKENPLPEIWEDEKPYELPKGWEWVRFGNVLDVRDGTHDTPKYVDSGIPLITSKNIDGNKIDFCNVKYISECDHYEISKRSNVDDGDILFAMIGSIGNPVIIKKDREFSIKNVALFKFYPLNLINNRYLHYYLLINQMNMKEQANGAVQSFVSLRYLRKYLFALPPFSEQKRIVEKVDSLMSFCDKLEKELERKVKYSSLSSKSVFNSIGSYTSAKELEETLRFIIENFKDLSLGDGAVKELKNAILQLVVQGKLVTQNPSDEPASILLEKIQAEKERLISEGKIKREKPLTEIREDEKPYELPEGWEWVRLGETIEFINGCAFKSNTYVDTSINQVIRLGNVKNDKLILEDKEVFVPDEIANDCGTYEIKENDILTTMTGTRGKRDYFYTCLVRKNDLDRKKLYLNQRVGLIRTYIKASSMFYNIVLKANFILDKVFESETGTANQGNIGVKVINELLIPLPPLNEQHRIVEKANSLLSLCDELEKRIEKSKEYSEKLAEALLKEAFKA